MHLATLQSLPCGLPAEGSPTAEETGYLHSIEAGSTQDGPGIRTVIFTTGCLLRCQFCHNPDTWNRDSGKPISVSELVAEIAKYAEFLKACNGGITFSGGEPMYQFPFVEQVIRRAKEELDLHVAIQTAAFLGDRISDDLLNLVDLWMVDIKSADPARYRLITGVDQPNMIRFLRRLAQHHRPTWASYVLVPGLTDDPAHLQQLALLLQNMPNLRRVDLRPFHQLGKSKWEALAHAYPLVTTLPPTPDQTEKALQILLSHNLPATIA